MTGIERRLAKLEATRDRAARMPVIFVDFQPRERPSPATVTVGGQVWHRPAG